MIITYIAPTPHHNSSQAINTADAPAGKYLNLHIGIHQFTSEPTDQVEYDEGMQDQTPKQIPSHSEHILPLFPQNELMVGTKRVVSAEKYTVTNKTALPTPGDGEEIVLGVNSTLVMHHPNRK